MSDHWVREWDNYLAMKDRSTCEHCATDWEGNHEGWCPTLWINTESEDE